MCRAHATVRGLLGEIVARTGNGRDIVVDMEAGLEHLSRGTGRHVSQLVAVLEPYFRSMETARRTIELARELELPRVLAVANKVRDQGDRDAIAEFCEAHGIELAVEIPYDEELPRSERRGMPPFEHAHDGPAVQAIGRLADVLSAGS